MLLELKVGGGDANLTVGAEPARGTWAPHGHPAAGLHLIHKTGAPS